MQRAYVFINAEPGKLWMIAEAASRVKGVKMADAVTGEFDVVIYVELETINQLSDLINQLQSIDGVLRTRTSIVIPPRLTSEH
jgi:DNA-binding Lrp family transcriptional regulator